MMAFRLYRAAHPEFALANTIAALAPELWYRFGDAASPAVNYGSLGSALNGTVVNASFRQAGPNARIPYAYDFNGTTTLLTIPTSAGLVSTDKTVAHLVNPDNAGESSVGAFSMLYTDADFSMLTRFQASMNEIRVLKLNTANGSFATVSNAGLTAGTWAWVFSQYNDATKKCTIWKSVSGVLTDITGTQPALTGTNRQSNNGGVGAALNGANTWDGKFAQFMVFNRLLTTAEMQNIITASGV